MFIILQLLIIFFYFISYIANTDTRNQFIKDGTTPEVVQKALATNINGTNFIMTIQNRGFTIFLYDLYLIPLVNIEQSLLSSPTIQESTLHALATHSHFSHLL